MYTVPDNIRTFFNDASKAGYRIQIGKQQWMLWSPTDRSLKIGGWSPKDSHWYVLSGAARNHEREMVNARFRKAFQKQRWYWMIEGAENAGVFRHICNKLTDHPI